MALSSCYDDDSTLPGRTINEVSINSQDSSVLRVTYLDELTINPDVNRGSEADTVGLSYKWEITSTAGTDQSDMIELGTGRNLHAVINVEPATQAYYLRYTVTDNENGGLQYTRLWNVYVTSSFLDGIVISDTHDGSTSDLNLIMSKDFTLDYNKDTRVYNNILEMSTGSHFDKLMTGLTYMSNGSLSKTDRHVNLVWAVTDDGDLAVFNTEEYTLHDRLSSGGVLTYRPSGLKVLGVYSFYSQALLLNTNLYLYTVNTINSTTFGWHDTEGSKHPIDNNVIMNVTSNGISDFLMWYDSEHGSFVRVNPASSLTSYVYSADIEANEYFNPQDMRGYTAIAAGQSVNGGIPSFVMRNNSDGSYAIYTFNRKVNESGYYDNDGNYIKTVDEQPASARMKYDLPSEAKSLLDNAVSTFFATNQSIMYIATLTGIYAVNFAGSSAILNPTPVYTPPAGETITKAKLYREGYDMQAYNNVGSNHDYASLPLNRRAVMVATSSGEYSGNLHVVPMTQIGTGNLDASSVRTFTGFGRILDFCTTAY